MKNGSTSGAVSPGAGAFTMIELLAVMAVAAIILTLAVPSAITLMQSSNMNRAGIMLTGEFNLDRQLALTQNRDIEIRFYQLGTTGASSDLQFRAFRSFYASSSSPSQAQALSPVRYLPPPVIICSGTFSTLLDYTNPSRSGLTQSQESLPGVSGSTNYISFLFRATGGTNLTPINPPVGNWFLTLYLENAPINPAIGIPNNYFAAQVDAVTGRVRTYQP